MNRWWQFAIGCCILFFILGGGMYGMLSQAMADSAVMVGVPVETTVEIQPALPNVNEPIRVIVGGVWSDGCVPDQLSHGVARGVIMIHVAMPDPELVCGQTLTPWSLVADLGQLPQAVYHVQVDGAVTLSATVTIADHLLYLPAISGQ